MPPPVIGVFLGKACIVEASPPVFATLGTACPLMPMEAGQMYINFGFWDALEGAETKGGNEVAAVNRLLEKACMAHPWVKRATSVKRQRRMQ